MGKIDCFSVVVFVGSVLSYNFTIDAVADE